MTDVTDLVRSRYAAAARSTPDDGDRPPTLGLGDPVALAVLRTGETVLDLGSGPGRDLLAAADAVGPSGRAIGVDMTPEMLDRARRATEHATNVSVLEGDLQNLPLPCSSIDVVISNCVINLVPDKRRALTETYRVLVPGGRLAVLDTAFDEEPGPEVREDPDAWCSCVGGSLVASDYAALLSSIGFTDVRLEPTDASCGEGCRDTASARSVAVTATKPGSWTPVSHVRPAVADDLDAIHSLLEAYALPIEGLRMEDTTVMIEGGRVLGAVALQRSGRAALLRSLVVAPDRHDEGIGSRLVIAALEVARWSGAHEVYLATKDAQRLFERWGFVAVSRSRTLANAGFDQLLSAECADAATMRLAFDDPGHPLTPLRKELPTFQDNSCC